MKKKKEIEIPKNKYIYQRYDGIITKYIVEKDHYIDVATGIATRKNETAFLGKVSENIIDLIEVGDIVYTYDVLNYDVIYIYDNEMLKAVKQDIEQGIKIKTIWTKEQLRYIEYNVN